MAVARVRPLSGRLGARLGQVAAVGLALLCLLAAMGAVPGQQGREGGASPGMGLTGVAAARARFDPDDFDPDEFDFDEPAVEADVDATGGAKLSKPAAGAQDADDFADMDSFEGNNAEAASAAGGDAKADSAPEPEVPARQTYMWESLAVAFIVLYGINFLIGRNTNQSIAAAFENEFCESIFAPQFSRVGLESDSYLQKQSQSQWRLYASGRRYCVGLLATLQLRKRHDLFSLASELVMPDRDQVVIDIPMNPEAMDTFVFAGVPARHRKAFHSGTEDLNNCAKPISHAGLPTRVRDETPSDFEVLVEEGCREVVSRLLPSSVCKALREHHDLFHAMHFTDQAPVGTEGTASLSRSALRFKFNLPPAKRMAELRSLIEMTVFYIDLVAQIRLGREAKRRADALRAEAALRAFKAGAERREETIQAKKEAAERKRREDYAKMTPEQQRKYDAKEAKRRERKERGGGGKMKMMVSR